MQNPFYRRSNRQNITNSFSIAISLQTWLTRLIFVGFILLSAAMLVMDHSKHPAATKIRVAITEVTTPVLVFLASPIQTISELTQELAAWQNAGQQNKRLLAENEQLKRWRLVATRLEAENKALRNLLNMAPAGQKHYITARVIHKAVGPYSDAHFMQAGREHGVMKNMPVINSDGLVGRVIEVGKQQSKLLPLTDINSRIAIITANSRQRAIAVGRNDDLLEMRHLPQNTKLKPGEQVLTAGDLGLFPANILVGYVARIEKDKILIKPAVDWSTLGFVSLIAPLADK